MTIFKNTNYLIIFLALCMGSINAQSGHEKTTVLDSIMIDAHWRTFEYHVPQYPVNNSRLVLVLHGDGMTTKSIQTKTGFEFNKLADNTGATIVVYPQGYKNYWNDCRREASFETKNKDINDVAFIKSIIQRMERRYHIDRKNVFVTGYFNGGNMCYKLAKTIPDVFKGFAAIGANLPITSNDDCVPINKAVSIMVINNVSDTINPYKGGELTSLDGFTRGKVLPTNETLDYWLTLLEQNDEATLSSLSSTIAKANSTFFRDDYWSKEKNKRVSLLKIVKGGYPFPNPHVNQWSQIAANMNKHINIPETVMRFFYQVQYSNPDHFNK
ncbi:alpha/beta hydrolase family esterase [Allomuricauda sp. R78024]|uniref:alpha/beta hydrolase family esterase n=1 Tax=Allomuricauda sp. R78024 TaxID=3093867 RepID=UPI0037CBBD3F